ncbi:MAG: hypothetical protein UY99_C0016G0013 [Parcubacteria group bacterium GW2011_GWA1_59_11]|nr:MAG: hypothetical protein UY99_C0016G0013 [Parcubacteria group bacterium GW2011_GWA1_59_11]
MTNEVLELAGSDFRPADASTMPVKNEARPRPETEEEVEDLDEITSQDEPVIPAKKEGEEEEEDEDDDLKELEEKEDEEEEEEAKPE